jgi:hypothetical protein
VRVSHSERVSIVNGLKNKALTAKLQGSGKPVIFEQDQFRG